MTKDQIMDAWRNCDQCPDFEPILFDLIDQRDEFIKFNSLLQEALKHTMESLNSSLEIIQSLEKR